MCLQKFYTRILKMFEESKDKLKHTLENFFEIMEH